MTNLLEVGLELLVLGMGGVFLFLLILVVLMNFSSCFFTKYAHLFPEAEATPAAKPAVASSVDEEIAVAIAAMTAHTK